MIAAVNLNKLQYIKTLIVGVAVALVFAVSAVPAFAATDPTSSQYCDGLGTTTNGCSEVGGQQSGGSSGGDAGGLSGQVSSLPFTGWDLIALSAIALGLLCGGMVLYWLSGPGQRRA